MAAKKKTAKKRPAKKKAAAKRKAKKKPSRKPPAKKAPAKGSRKTTPSTDKPELRDQPDMLLPVSSVPATDDISAKASELADYIGVTERRVRQLVDEGVVQRAARDRYWLKASIQAYCRYLKNLRDGAESKKSEETRLTKVRAEQHEFDLAVKRRAFYPAREVDEALLRVATLLTSILDGSASRIASSLGGGGTLRKKLIDEFHALRAEFAAGLAEFSGSLAEDGWGDRATRKPAARRVGRKKKKTSARKR